MAEALKSVRLKTSPELIEIPDSDLVEVHETFEPFVGRCPYRLVLRSGDQ
jgi:hypothetical protein